MALQEIKGQMRAGDGGGLGGGAEREAGKCEISEISGLETRWACSPETKYGRCRVMAGTGGDEEFSNSLELEHTTVG